MITQLCIKSRNYLIPNNLQKLVLLEKCKQVQENVDAVSLQELAE